MSSQKVIIADLDEMVFEGREKRYGAFDLRKKHHQHISVGLMLVSLCFTLVAFSPRIEDALFPTEERGDAKKQMVVQVSMTDLPPPPPVNKEVELPPPPPKLKPPQVRTVAFRIPEPTPESELEEKEEATITEVEELKDAPNIGIEDKEGEETGFFDGEIDGAGDVPVVIVEEKTDEPDVHAFIVVEEQPQAVNMKDIQAKIGYPVPAMEANIEGVVILRVLINKQGLYQKHIVLNSVHPILSEAVESHISKLRFTPAVQGGIPIAFWVNVPFNFKLL